MVAKILTDKTILLAYATFDFKQYYTALIKSGILDGKIVNSVDAIDIMTEELRKEVLALAKNPEEFRKFVISHVLTPHKSK